MDNEIKKTNLEGEEEKEAEVTEVPDTANMGAELDEHTAEESGPKDNDNGGNAESESNNSEEGQPTDSTEPADTSAEGNDIAEPVQDDTVAAEVVEQSQSQLDTPAPIVEEDGAIETSIKTFTQDDVDKLVGDTRVRTREKTFNYIYNRYGVKSEEELDSLVANAQRYDTQKEMYDNDKASWEKERAENDTRLNEMSEQIALMQSEIDPARYEDAKLILKGKNMEVNLENIQSELNTHPEWKKEEPKPESNPVEEKPAEVTRIKALGNEQKPAPTVSEEEQAEKLFKMKFH